MTSMNVPEPVMSLAIAPASKDVGPQVQPFASQVRKFDVLMKENWFNIYLSAQGTNVQRTKVAG